MIRATPLALAALALMAAASAQAQAQQPAPNDEADVRALIAQLESLKANYAQEVRRLRELDMQVQAMQARLTGKTAPVAGAAPPPQQALPPGTPAASARASRWAVMDSRSPTGCRSTS